MYFTLPCLVSIIIAHCPVKQSTLINISVSILPPWQIIYSHRAVFYRTFNRTMVSFWLCNETSLWFFEVRTENDRDWILRQSVLVSRIQNPLSKLKFIQRKQKTKLNKEFGKGMTHTRCRAVGMLEIYVRSALMNNNSEEPWTFVADLWPSSRGPAYFDKWCSCNIRTHITML